jgi:hypothetical protein
MNDGAKLRAGAACIVAWMAGCALAAESGEAGQPGLITFSKIDQAWKSSQGENTKVAVLDWLFDLSPEASDKYVHPTSMVPNQEIGSAEPWHGEWMAGIVHKIAPKAKIIPIRVVPGCKDQSKAGCDRESREQYLIAGLLYAIDKGAVAVTNSTGPTRHSPRLIEAIEQAEKQGTVFVDVHPEYVGFDRDDFSFCTPDQCDGRIIRTGIVSIKGHPTEPEAARDLYVWPFMPNPVYKDGWGYSNGPPTVAGVIALMKGANPSLSPARIRTILFDTARMVDGFRVLDAEAAVRAALEQKSAE